MSYQSLPKKPASKKNPNYSVKALIVHIHEKCGSLGHKLEMVNWQRMPNKFCYENRCTRCMKPVRIHPFHQWPMVEGNCYRQLCQPKYSPTL